MKKHLFLAATAVFLVACDARISTPPAEKVIEKNKTIIINPPGSSTTEEKKTTTTTTDK